MKPVSAYQITFEDFLFSDKINKYRTISFRKAYRQNVINSCIVSIIVFTASISTVLLYIKVLSINNMISGESRIIPKDDLLFHVNISDSGKPGNTPKPYAGSLIPSKEELKSTNDSCDQYIDHNKTTIFINDKEHLWIEKTSGNNHDLNQHIPIVTADMIYPVITGNNTGKILLSFIIEKDGSITNAKIKKGPGEYCSEIALRTMLTFKKWEPVTNNGMPVRVKLIVPIVYKLDQ